MNVWEFVIEIMKQPAGWVMLGLLIFIVIQFASGNWRICRDKNGKVLFTTASASGQYDMLKEHIKNDNVKWCKVETALEENKQALDDTTRWVQPKDFENLATAVQRLEIANIIQHAPHEKTLIKNMYDNYKNAGHNAYIDDLYREWEKTNANN